MRKTLNYWAFIWMAVITEFLFLLFSLESMKITGDIYTSFFLLSAFFVTYRFLIDWRVFNKEKVGNRLHELSKTLRYPLIEKDLVFAFLMGFAVVLSNWLIIEKFDFLRLWAWGSASVALSWLIVDGYRRFELWIRNKLANKIKVHTHTYKIAGGEVGG
ncbi:MAG: hypothetical protein ACTSV7_14880 [Candidatus Baldrarchaeia archaeon]